VVVSDDPEVNAMASASNDTAATIGAQLASGSTTDRFGELLQPSGIRYVVLSKVQDWRLYAWLFAQEDLRVVAEWDDLVLFENLATGAPVIGSGDETIEARG
jgi:hypothetical protein